MPRAARTHKEKQNFEQDRPSAALRGYGYWWSNAKKTGVRDRFLRRNPLCAECMRAGRTVAATVVDHVVPHKGDRRLMRDIGNMQSLCDSCHNAKSARERWEFINQIQKHKEKRNG